MIYNMRQIFTNQTEKGKTLRRIFHLLFALAILYYLLPPTIFGFPTYLIFVILFVILPLSIETLRLKTKVLFLGLHDSEKDHIASYVWFTIGATILVLFFPQQIAAPCIVATAIGDPVLGLTKRYRRRFMLSVPFLVILIVFLIFDYSILLAIIAAGITLIAESFEFKVRMKLRPNIFWSRSKKKFSIYRYYFNFLFRTDDDFMMQIIPAVILSILFLIFPELFPQKVLLPLPGLIPYA
jgi:hypothetical protein